MTGQDLLSLTRIQTNFNPLVCNDYKYVYEYHYHYQPIKNAILREANQPYQHFLTSIWPDEDLLGNLLDISRSSDFYKYFPGSLLMTAWLPDDEIF